MDTQSQGSSTWILVVLLVIAVVLAICFYTQKRIIEKDRDSLVAETQSSKDLTLAIESTQQEVAKLKKVNDELTRKLTDANDSISQFKKEVAELKSKLSTA